MKKYLLFFLFFFVLQVNVYPQEKDTSIFTITTIQEMPAFPGGNDSLWCFLESNYNYDILNSDSVSVTYFLKFMVDSCGMARNFSFLGTKPTNIITNNESLKRIEILRVLSILPRWNPGRQGLKKVNIWFTISIKTPIKEFRCKRLKDQQKEKITATNTDNKRHLFVTVFEHPAFYIMTLISLNPDSHSCSQVKPLYLDKFLASSMFCTATLHQCPFIKLLYHDKLLTT